jgi:hypothetical protein
LLTALWIVAMSDVRREVISPVLRVSKKRTESAEQVLEHRPPEVGDDALADVGQLVDPHVGGDGVDHEDDDQDRAMRSRSAAVAAPSPPVAASPGAPAPVAQAVSEGPVAPNAALKRSPTTTGNARKTRLPTALATRASARRPA